VTSQSRNVFPTFVPVNLDPNFRPPDGVFLNSPTFFSFRPTDTPLIRPGTLNSYNLPPEAFATGLGTLFVQAPPLPGGDLSSNGLAFTLPEKGFQKAYSQHMTLTVERQLGNDHLVAVSYVGTLGKKQTRFLTPNAGLQSTPLLISSPIFGPLIVLDLPPRLGSEDSGRPVPDLGAYTVFANSSPSSYNSLQVLLQRRFRSGVQFQAAWTWAHAIDEVSDPFDGRSGFALPQNQRRLDLERAPAAFDVRQRLASYLLWDLPPWTLLKNSRLTLAAELQSGQPYTVNTSLDRNLDGNLTDRLNSGSGIEQHVGTPWPLRLSPSVDRLDLVAPRGRDGEVGRNTFRSQGIVLLDIAFQKAFQLAEQERLSFQLEVFNLLNRRDFADPVRILESPGFGRSFDTQAEPRSIRLSARFQF
jgi:hypothetical protein